MKFRNMPLGSSVLITIGLAGTVFAFGQHRYLCPAVPFGAGGGQENDRCICTTTNWSHFAVEVTTELFQENGDPYDDNPVIDVVEPNATEVVIRPKPEGDRACSCMVTTHTRRAQVSLSTRRNTTNRVATVNCKLMGIF